jgi:glycosyltransferase involved in cell wall biosynthesis
MTSTALVSVCIPTYNRAAGLRRAVRSVQANDYGPLEIIISDNASQDDTEAMARELAAADPRIRYFRHERNHGPTRNFQFAREQARGQYFMWCGDDDYLAADYIRRCVSVLQEDAAILLAAGIGAYHRGDDRVEYLGNRLALDSACATARVAHYLFRVRDNSIFYGLYRCAAVAPCHMPNALGGDWIWMTDILMRGKAAVLPDTFIYRRFGDTTSSSHARIVATLGAPAWHARYRFFAITANFLRYFAAAPDYRARPLPLRAIYMTVIFAAMGFRATRQNGKRLLLRVPVLGNWLQRVLDPY